jgi:hypothetical protein
VAGGTGAGGIGSDGIADGSVTVAMAAGTAIGAAKAAREYSASSRKNLSTKAKSSGSVSGVEPLYLLPFGSADIDNPLIKVSLIYNIA